MIEWTIQKWCFLYWRIFNLHYVSFHTLLVFVMNLDKSVKLSCSAQVYPSESSQPDTSVQLLILSRKSTHKIYNQCVFQADTFKPKPKRLQHNVKDMKALPSMNKNCLSSFEMLSAPAPVNDSSAKVATLHQRLTLTRLDGDSAEENIPGCQQKGIAQVTEVWTEKTGSSSMYATIAILNRLVVLDDFQ